MKVADGVEMLELTANIMGQVNKVHPVWLTGNGDSMLIDTGYPGQLEVLQQILSETGAGLNNITKIIMTHHDIDHIGNLAAIVKTAPHKIEVFSHEQEKPYIQGDLPPAKAPRAEDQNNNERLKLMSQEQQQAVLRVFQNFKMFTVPVDCTLHDGQILPWFGGITVIHTPGHTPGHICLYLHKSKILIAGDALFIENDSLVPPPAMLNLDNNLALSSLAKLNKFDIAAIICYHGGLYTMDPDKTLDEITSV